MKSMHVDHVNMSQFSLVTVNKGSSVMLDYKIEKLGSVIRSVGYFRLLVTHQNYINSSRRFKASMS